MGWKMADREMTNEEAIEILSGIRACYNIFDEYDEPKYAALSKAIFALRDEKIIFYDGYTYCLMDFGKDTVLCKDCKHYKQSAVADRKMCFRKDVDGVEVCYDFLPYDSCTYGERRDEVEEDGNID